ncbi:MAG: hypothetical protein HYW50_01815, partial [Candidatus Diapherotrites archaeon]|nr:hypothetical protein [Candidatus Diapherotrites archaeon]
MKLLFSKEPKNFELAVFILTPQTLKEALSKELAQLKEIVPREKFEAKEEQSLFLAAGFGKFRRALFFGLGEQKIDAEKVRRAAGSAVFFAQGKKIEKISFFVPDIKEVSKKDAAVALVEGSILANYSFQKYKTVEQEKKIFVKETELSGELD